MNIYLIKVEATFNLEDRKYDVVNILVSIR